MTDREILIWYEGLEQVTCNTNEPEKKIIAYVKEALNTAHAAAIQAAANFIEEASKDGYEKIMSWGQIKSGILVLTPAASQRLYDLRIKEAVRDELVDFDKSLNENDFASVQSNFGEAELQRRLTSANAEVERLKAENS